MKYFITGSENIEKLIDKVNKYIEQGYQPSGGVAVYSVGSCVMFLQAMVKKSPRR